jgi:acyl carrier protein
MEDKVMFEKVQAIIANELGIDKEKITMESRLAEDLGADSLDAVELIMALEDEFGIEVDDEAATKIKKVSDIVEFLEK